MKLASSHRSGGAADVEQEVGDVVERVAAGGPCDRHLGVVDDFGTGYSSLAYLRRFPIDRIKLDRSFVRELPEFEQTAAIVRAIYGLSKAIDLELVAEGIEREAEAAFLEREGIVTAQGYLYCRPLPLDDVCAFFDRERRAVSKAA